VKEPSAYYDDFSQHYDAERDRGYHACSTTSRPSACAAGSGVPRVLEIGCGTGLVLERVRRFAARASGMDLSGGMLSRARARGLTVCRASALALPYRERSFDLVYSFKVLPHVEALDRHSPRRARAHPRRDRAAGVLQPREPARHVEAAALVEPARGQRVARPRGLHRVPTRRRPARARARAAGLEVVGGYGIFVVTPHPFAHRLPLAGAMLGAIERTLTQGPFARWAGFYIVACRKPGGRR
jgi:SAM-dependent methyltransferase